MIPALAFNDAITPTTTDVLAAGENLAKGFRQVTHFSPLGDNKDFYMKSSTVKINNLILNSVVSSGIDFGKKDPATLYFVVMLEGTCITEVDGVRFGYNALTEALSSFGEESRASLVGSGVGLRLEIQKLSQTCSAILGYSHDAETLTKSHVLSLQKPEIQCIEIFKSLLSQIDLSRGDANILSKLALDDSFYRLCATLLCPEIFLADGTRNGRHFYVRPEINRLCEYMAAHLTEAISLTEMESMSGLSARILQRSFQIAFGLSPKQWVRKQRLHAARSVMLNRREPISITALAYDFCFASPSDFAHHYALEFGEHPSHTLGRKIPSVSAKSSVQVRK